jgi:hypothetical protein
MGKIVWLASYPKSGNTWLRAFLHNLFRNPAAWFREFDPRPATQLSYEDVAKLRPKVQAALTRVFPDNVFVKTHSALVESHGVPMHMMELTAGAIYVMRNPLDVVVSFADHYGLTIDAAIVELNRPMMMSPNEERHVYQVFGSWSENVESWTANPNPALHVMRYEDMLEKPLETFGKVARFLGLKPAPDRLQRAIDLAAFGKLRQQEEQTGFRERSEKSERFFREGRAGQWREKLTPAQIEAITAAHRAQMTRFGYLPLPPITRH